MKVTKVVQFDQVEQLTSSGWALVCNVQNQRIDTKKELEQHSHSTSHGWIPDKYKIDTAVVNETLFVLEKDAEAVDIDRTLQSQLHAAEEYNRKLREKVFALEEDARKLIKQRDELTKFNVEVTAKRDHFQKERDAGDTRMRKLEEDLAKVRKAVGELKWAEILGAKS